MLLQKLAQEHPGLQALLPASPKQQGPAQALAKAGQQVDIQKKAVEARRLASRSSRKAGASTSGP